MSKKVIIVGGSGFIGGHIVREFLAKEFECLLVTTSGSDFKNLDDIKEKYAKKISYHSISDFSSDKFRELVANSDYFIHAGIPYQLYTIGWKNKWEEERTQLSAMLEQLMLGKIKKCVFLSVAGTIGPKIENTQDEHSPYLARSKYTSLTMKNLAEQLILDYEKKGLPVVVLNPCLSFGIYDCKPSSGSYLLMLKKLPFYFFKDKMINIVDVEDIAKATSQAISIGKSGERYLIGHLNIRFSDFHDKIRAMSGKPKPMFSIPDWMILTLSYGSELFGKLFSRKQPSIPVLSLDIIRFGSRDFKFDKLENDLKVKTHDPMLACKQALEWFEKNNYR